jgi:hypothetical protein
MQGSDARQGDNDMTVVTALDAILVSRDRIWEAVDGGASGSAVIELVREHEQTLLAHVRILLLDQVK